MNDRMTLEETFRALASYGPAVWAGVVAAIAVFVIEIILCTKGILFSSAEKKIERAKKMGHMIIARRKSMRFRDRESENSTTNRMYIATYEYVVDGECKTKQVISTSVKPPYQITLYYLNSPKKVFSSYDVGKNPLKILLFIIPVLVAYVVMTLLGFKP